MQSTLTKQADPHDVFLIESVLAACAKLAPSEPADRAASPPLAPQAEVASGVSDTASAPAVDTTFRAAAVDAPEVPPGEAKNPLERSSVRKWVTRTTFGMLLTVASAVAAAAWQQYGDVAMQTIARWTPAFTLASSPSAARVMAEQPASPATQAAVADATPVQPAPSAQPAQDIAPAVAAAAADPAPLPPSVAHDLAAMGQQIETLKASIEQLKAGQEEMARQMSRDVAARSAETKSSEIKPAEQAPRPRLAALPPRPVAPPPRKPRPAFSPAPVAAVPAAPAPVAPALPPPPMTATPLPSAPQAQPMTEPDGEPVLRPPMPLR
jgi:hypothetical protein